MTPDILLRLLLSSLTPDDPTAALSPTALTTSLLGPVGGEAGSPYGLWGSLMGGLNVPELSEIEQFQTMFPMMLGMRLQDFDTRKLLHDGGTI